MFIVSEDQNANRVEYNVVDGMVYQTQHYVSRSGRPYSVTVNFGDVVQKEEVNGEVIIYEFDLTQKQFVERERIPIETDNPATTDVNEGQTFWQRVMERLLFWREN